MDVTEDVDSLVGSEMFNEPSEYFQKAKRPTTAKHVLKSGRVLEVGLIGHSPLWGHLLWNAGRTVADLLEEKVGLYVSGKNCLELGAGSGLPGIVCALQDAKKVVITDYPDNDLVDNIRANVSKCQLNPDQVFVTGLLWGSEVDHVKSFLDQPEQGFDLLILADLLFNHSEHEKLLKTVQDSLKKSDDAHALVFFTPYRPWLLEKDLRFLDLAKAGGLSVKQISETVMEKALFEDDPGVSLQLLKKIADSDTNGKPGRVTKANSLRI